MSKKRTWLGLIKRLFFPETQHHQKITRRRRWLFGRLKRTKTLPSPSTSPSPPKQPPLKQTTVDDDDDDDEKQSICEAGVVKDHTIDCETELPKPKDSEIITKNDYEKIVSLICESDSTCDQIVAAITIQTAFRSFLARKALRALKGFVRLQAIIRGTAVRRQAITTLKCLESIAKIQSEVRARRCQMIRGKDGDLLTLQDLRNQSPKIQLCRLRRLDNELLSKEEEIDIILRKKEAILRSKKIKPHSFNHRYSADAVLDSNSQGRLKYWLEQYVSNEVVPKKEGITSFPRTSFHNKHKRQNSYGEQDNLQLSSPTNSLPTYMAATESAKARTRSTNSSPRVRPVHLDVYSDSESPYKHRFSPMSSINSEATCSGFSKVSHKTSFSSCYQKSPSLKGVSGPVRSNKNLK